MYTEFEGSDYGDRASVTFNIRDNDEQETVTLSTTSPRVGQAVTATLSGEDNIIGTPTWEWKRGDSSTVIATGSSYTPSSSDVGKTLTATATYTDSHASGKTANESTDPVANPTDPYTPRGSDKVPKNTVSLAFLPLHRLHR